MSRLDRFNEAVKGLARPIAKQGISGLRAGLGNLFASPWQRQQVQRGYGSGAYSGSYYQMAQLFKELRADPTGLSLAAEETEIIYNCLMVRCNAITGLEWGIYPKAGKRDSNSKVENTPFHRMIEYAQTEYDQDFFFLWELSLGVHGEVFFEKLPRPDGLPGGLRYLNRIAIDPFIAGGQIQYYSYFDDAGATNFRPDQLIRDGLPNLLDDFSGSSDVARALAKVNSDRGRGKHVLSYFRNGAKIGGWLTLRQGSTLTEIEWGRLKKEFQEHLAGADNAYKWGLLPAEIEAKSSDNQPFEHYQELEDSDVQRMHWAMHVPPVLTGAIPASDPLSSLGTLDAAKAFFYENYVQSRAKHIATVINEKILPWMWMGDYELVFGVDKVLSTMRQTKEQSDKIRAEYDGGNITFNEMREQLGYDTAAGGDWIKVPIPQGALIVRLEDVGKVPDMAAQMLAAQQPAPAPATPPAPAPDANKDVTPATPVGKSMCVMLMMPNHPDLMSLQNRVKAYLGDETTCQWNDPATFHVTLLYAPAVPDAQMKAFADQLSQMELPELKLNIGSLGVFENVGEYPVHFKIRQNADLLACQSQMYEAAKAAGIQMSSYSQPSFYQPHITMGYATTKPKAVTFKSKLSVVPEALHLAADDDVLLKLSLLDEDEPEPPPAQVKPPFKQITIFAGGEAPQGDALDELRAWQRKIENAQRGGKALGTVKFQNYLVRDAIADGIRASLAEAADKEMVDGIFDRARELVSYKAIQATRIDFEDEFDDLLNRARNDEATRQQFRSKLASLLNKYGKMAFMDGLTDGGIDEPVLDEEDQNTIARMLAEQSQYVTGITDVLFKGDGVSDAMAEFKPAMWFNKSINPMYQAGLVSADKNGLYEWVYGDTEHCEDCIKLNGQRHRLKEFDQRGLMPQADRLACKGFNCKCKLVKVAGKARGNWLEAAA